MGDLPDRRAKRIDHSYEAKVKLPEQSEQISVSVKDLSRTGVRFVVGARPVKNDTVLDIAIDVNKRVIVCKGKVVWCLPLRPGMGGLMVFDVGIKFTEIALTDQEFIEQLAKEDGEK